VVLVVEQRSEAALVDADDRVGHAGDRRVLEVRGDFSQVARTDAGVRVAYHQDAVARGALERDQLIHLRVVARRGALQLEAHHLRPLPRRADRHRVRGIVLALHAEDYLVLGVVEVREAGEVLFESVIRAAKRLEDRDRRERRRHLQRAAQEASNGAQLHGERDDSDCRGDDQDEAEGEHRRPFGDGHGPARYGEDGRGDCNERAEGL
jgi:hypothetical protein